MDYKGFFDLNIDYEDDDLWKNLDEYNVRTIAINHQLDMATFDETKKKKGEKKELIVPAPTTVQVPEEYKQKIAVVKRLTIQLADGGLFHKIVQAPNYKQYDIIAVIPANQQTLQFCCASNEIDMICFEPLSKPQWSISRKLYKIAVQKNIFFELQYGPIIKDASSRKNTIQIAHTYHIMGKLKNIIISSGTGKADLLRTPYDVMNFGFLLGFNEKETKKTITHNPKQLLLRAGNRRLKKDNLLNISMTNKLELKLTEQSEPVEMDIEGGN